MSVPKLTLAGLVVLCVSCGALGVSSAPALAGTGYRFDHAFGELGAGEDQFSEAGAVAVNQTSGDVYVGDHGNNRVERFDAKGSYLGQFNGSGAFPNEEGKKAPEPLSPPGGIAVDNSPSSPSNGDVYVIDNEHSVIDKFSPTGSYIGQITETSGGEHLSELEGGIAVDSTGVVWVYRTTGEIDSFSNALVNVFITNVTSPYEASFGGFAVDSHDNLYVKTSSGHVAKLNSSGVSLIEDVGGEVPPEATAGVAVDLATNNVFIASEATVGVLNETASPIATIALGSEHSARGIGTDSATSTVYVAEYGQVDIFSPGPTPPPPNTDPVSNVTATSATLNGDLNPEGVAGGVGFYFSYNVGASCTGEESNTTTRGNATGSADVPESAVVTGLQPNAPYAVCFFATSEFGATPGPTVTFATPPAKPSVDQESTSGLTLTEATLKARINPNNQLLTSCKFEYGETNTYGHELPCEPPGLEGYGDKPVAANIVGGLTSAETYHYRVVAVNATGTTEGPDQTFTTLPFPPTVTFEAATAGTDTATVTFTANAQGGDTEYAVRYGAGMTYTAQVQGDAGHSRGAVPITVSLPELAPGTTYHFSVKVQNAGGQESTPDQILATLEAPSPAAKEPTTTEEPPATVPLVLAQPATPPLMFAAIVFPTETGTVSPPKPLTRAQRLSKALKQCKKDKKKTKRKSCEKEARKKYGPKAKTKK
jgi:hypothetical protein